MPAPEFTTEELSTERWLPVVGYEGFYSVSDLGRVMRMGGSPRCKKDRLLNPSDTGSTGYLSVSLSVGGKRKGVDVHLLVMAAFVGPCPEGHNVNHKDNVKTNGRLSNLEYLTFSQNTQHALALGAMATGDRNPSRLHPEKLPHGDDHWTHKFPERVKRGEKHVTAKLTEAQVRTIRQAYAAGSATQHDLATQHGVTVMTINCLLLKKTWKHI